jgi:hypothetical protein
MIKYIVTWVLLKTIPTSCPDANKTDKFGRVSNTYGTCAVFHAEIKGEKLRKEFYSKDSATAFYNELLIEAGKSNIIFGNGIDSVVLIKSK